MNARSKDLKFVALQGGLGNQMFQYAFGLFLQQTFNSHVLFDRSFLEVDIPGGTKWHFVLDQLDVPGEFRKRSALGAHYFVYRALLERKLSHKLGLKGNLYWENPGQAFDSSAAAKAKLFVGYWQKPFYLDSLRHELLAAFKPKSTDHPEFQNFLHKITAAKTSVSLHIRRGDYLSNPTAALMHGVCDISYYQKAVEVIEKKYSSPQYFVFSDDIEWCRQNLKFLKNVEFVNLGKAPAILDITLQAACQHNIIANSSFSWWAAWLNQNPEKTVICPQKWFIAEKAERPLMPDKWVAI